MFARAVFFASTGAALLLFVGLAHIQIDSRAFTSAPRVDPYADEYPLVPSDVAKELVALPDALEPNVLTLSPLVITGDASKAAPLSSAENLAREASVPCSEWRELGPAYVTDGNPSGSIRVRNLC